jgi:hypothetical protein
MSTNGHHNETTKPTSDELRRWAKAPEQVNQPLITESEFMPEEAKQPRPLSGNPVIKIALVAGMMLPIFTVAGLLLNASHPSQSPREATQSVNSKTGDSPENSEAETAAKQREELGHTQAELAIANQTQALKNQPALKQAPTPKVQPSNSTTIAARPVVSPAPVSSVSDTPPAPRVIQPPVSRSITPVSPPVERSSVAAQPRSDVRGVSASETTPQESYDRYLALTQLGSYGQVSPEASNTQTDPPSQSATVNAAQSETQPSTEATLVALQPAVPKVKPEEEASILAEQPQRSLLAATKAEGILTTPIVFDQGKVQDDRFTIQLARPIKAEDGSIALPSGTQLIVQVNSIAETGLVKLQAVSAIVNQEGQQAEMSLPSDAIRIRGKDGKPLIAQNYGDKGKAIASMDAGTFALGALNKASELFTRSQSSTVVSNNGGLITSTQNPKPNLLAGVLQGGSQALLDTIKQRNQQAIQAIAQQPNIRFLPAGSVVEVYVNRSLPLPTDLITASAPSGQSSPDDVVIPVEPSSIPQESVSQRIQDTEILQRSDRSLPAPEGSIVRSSLPNVEWSSSLYAETFSHHQPRVRSTPSTQNCDDGSATCANNLDGSSSRQIRQYSDDSGLGRIGDKSQLPTDWGADSTGLAR